MSSWVFRNIRRMFVFHLTKWCLTSVLSSIAKCRLYNKCNWNFEKFPNCNLLLLKQERTCFINYDNVSSCLLWLFLSSMNFHTLWMPCAMSFFYNYCYIEASQIIFFLKPCSIVLSFWTAFLINYTSICIMYNLFTVYMNMVSTLHCGAMLKGATLHIIKCFRNMMYNSISMTILHFTLVNLWYQVKNELFVYIWV